MPEAAAVRPKVELALRSLLRADLLVLVRSPVVLVLNVVVPVFIVVLIGLRSRSGALSGTLGGNGFAVALALTIGLMTSSLFGYSVALARDREAGVLQRMRVTPTPGWAILGSRLLLQMAADLLMTVIVLVVAMAMRQTGFDPGQVVLFLACSMLGGTMFLGLAQVIVALARSAALVSAISRVAYIVLLVLGLGGISGLLGPVIGAVAAWSPVGALLEAYIGVIAPSAAGWSSTAGVLAMLAYVVLGVLVGVRWFRWEP